MTDLSLYPPIALLTWQAVRDWLAIEAPDGTVTLALKPDGDWTVRYTVRDRVLSTALLRLPEGVELR